MRRFARAAYCQVAHADSRYLYLLAMKDMYIVQQVSKTDC